MVNFNCFLFLVPSYPIYSQYGFYILSHVNFTLSWLLSIGCYHMTHVHIHIHFVKLHSSKSSVLMLFELKAPHWTMWKLLSHLPAGNWFQLNFSNHFNGIYLINLIISTEFLWPFWNQSLSHGNPIFVTPSRARLPPGPGPSALAGAVRALSWA
jgi:hypothetical protein